MSLLDNDSRFFEESINSEKLQALLAGRSHNAASGLKDRTQAMKWLLAMISKGRDVSHFYPDVVKNVIVKSVELKKLVYVYLMHYTDHDKTCRELALLSINSFQKDLADSNPLIRALALRTMTSIRVRDIIQLQLMAVQKCASDSSPYVRKTAAHAVPKIHGLDPSNKVDLVELISKLLADRSAMVTGSAMAAFNEVCPNDFSILHPIFRRLCGSLGDLDEWGQALTLSVLVRYARAHFAKPAIEPAGGGEPSVSDSATFSSYDQRRDTTFGSGTSGGGEVRPGHSAHLGFAPSANSSSSFDQEPPTRVLPGETELRSFYDDDEDEDETSHDHGTDPSDSSQSKKQNKKNKRALVQQGDDNGYNLFTGKGRNHTNNSSNNSKKNRDMHSSRTSSSSSVPSIAEAPVAQRTTSTSTITSGTNDSGTVNVASEGSAMEADHKLLLKSCLPLLRSSNSGVVLAAVSMLWSCGRKSRTAMTRSAEALVRLLRASREVQFAALNAIGMCVGGVFKI